MPVSPRTPSAELTPLRVALLATVVDFGGIERVLLSLVRNMTPEVQFFPVLFTREGVGEKLFLESLRELGVAHQAFPLNTSRFKYHNPLRNIGETIDIARKRQFDIIHSHGYRANMVGFAAAKRLGLPIVATCHGYIANDRQLNAYNRLDMLLLRWFDRIVAVSEQMKRDLMDRKVDGRKIQVVTNAVWDGTESVSREGRKATRRLMGIGEKAFVFGFVGRHSEEKGLRYLMEAAQGMPDNEDWRILLVGDGPLRITLEAIARTLVLKDRFLFAGFQSDTAAWYSAMDAMVLPSLTEGTPMALLEAMAHGLPVIASAVGGVPAVIRDGESGILVPPGDPARLLNAMRTVIEDPALRKKLSSGAIRAVQLNYNVRSWADRMREVYTATLQKRRGTA